MSVQTQFRHIALAILLSSSPGIAENLSTIERAILDKDRDGLVKALSDVPDMTSLKIGNTPALIRAAVEGSPEIVTALLDKGAPIDAQDRDGFTALMQAIVFSRTEIIDLLVDRDADLTVENIYGQRAEDLARARGDFSLAQLVAVYSIDVDLASSEMLAAAQRGDRNAMQRAFNKRANMLARDAQGRSLLQIALDARKMEVIKFLASKSSWKSSGLVHPDDPKMIIESALIQPLESEAAKFHGDALSTLLDSGVFSSQDIQKAFADITNDPSDQISTIRQVISDLGLSNTDIDIHFPKPAPPLPDLEFALPYLTPPGGVTLDDWKDVQRILASEGLYDGAIDGIPGTGTFDAIYAYVMPLIDIVIARSEVAARRAKDTEDGPFGASQTAGKSGKRLEFTGQRVRRNGRYLPVGYTVKAEGRNGGIDYGFLAQAATFRRSDVLKRTFGYFSVTCSKDRAFMSLDFTLLGYLVSISERRDLIKLHRNGVERFPIPGKFNSLRC